MTTQEAHRNFQIELDKREISAAPSFLHDEIDYLLYSAYLTLIKQKFTGNNKLQQAFEQDAKRISDLQGLIRNIELSGFVGDEYAVNECKFQVTNQDFVMLPVSMIFRYNDLDRNSVILTNHDIISNFRKSDINNPWIPVPTGIYENDSVRICIDPIKIDTITSGFPKLLYTYIKFPEKPNYNIPGQLFEVDFVDEIISLAVDYALDNVEAQRIQIHTQLAQNKE